MNAKEAFNDVIRQFKKRGSTGFTCKEVYTQLRSKSVKISLDTVRGWLYESADNGELTSRLKGNSCIFSPVIKKIVQEEPKKGLSVEELKRAIEIVATPILERLIKNEIKNEVNPAIVSTIKNFFDSKSLDNKKYCDERINDLDSTITNKFNSIISALSD